MYEIFIRNKPSTTLDDVFLILVENEKYFYIENGDLCAAKIEPGGSAKPLFTAPTQDVRAIVQAFLAVARDIGIKPHHEGKTEGQLDATLKHLADMRTLVFKK